MSEFHWLLPEDLLQKSIAVMRPHGALGNEGLALWLGEANGSVVHVTHLIDITGPGFKTSPLYMGLSMRAMASAAKLPYG